MAETPPARAHATVFVRGLTVEAEIGVYAHELDRRQPLVVDVEIGLEHAGSLRLADTFNYELVRTHARRIAQAGHIGLVETFAWRLARACLAEHGVHTVRVRVEKPMALAPDAQAAGVEITLAKE